MKTPTLFILTAVTATAATSWNGANDNIANLSHPAVASFNLVVSETSGLTPGDGFELNMTTVGGPVDLSIGGGPQARFDVTIPATSTNVTSVTFVLDYDRAAFPLNPDRSGGSLVQSLGHLAWISGEDVQGDLTFTDLIATPSNPVFHTVQTTYNGGANFTLNPGDDSVGAFRRYSNVHNLIGGSVEPTHGGLILSVTPDDGGAFAPGSSFRFTFDSGFTVVPEPTGSALLLLSLVGLTATRRRSS